MLVYCSAVAAVLAIGSALAFVDIRKQPAHSYESAYAHWYCTNELAAERSLNLEERGGLTSDDVWMKRVNIPSCTVGGRVVRKKTLFRTVMIGKKRFPIYEILVDDDSQLDPIVAYTGPLANT